MRIAQETLCVKESGRPTHHPKWTTQPSHYVTGTDSDPENAQSGTGTRISVRKTIHSHEIEATSSALAHA